MEEGRKKAVGVELGFLGEVEKVKVAEAEAFFDEGFGVGLGEDFVAEFELAPGEALEFGDSGFERGSLGASVIFE